MMLHCLWQNYVSLIKDCKVECIQLMLSDIQDWSSLNKQKAKKHTKMIASLLPELLQTGTLSGQDLATPLGKLIPDCDIEFSCQQFPDTQVVFAAENKNHVELLKDIVSIYKNVATSRDSQDFHDWRASLIKFIGTFIQFCSHVHIISHLSSSYLSRLYFVCTQFYQTQLLLGGV